MSFGRLRYPHRLSREPHSHLLPSSASRFRAFEDPQVRYKAQKCEHAGPRQTNGGRSVELLIEPLAGEFVLSEGAHMQR